MVRPSGAIYEDNQGYWFFGQSLHVPSGQGDNPFQATELCYRVSVSWCNCCKWFSLFGSPDVTPLSNVRHIFLSQYFITHILSRVFNENEAWRPIQTKKSLEVYASELTRFLACILRTLSSGLGYQFSLSSAQKEAAQALWMKLDGSDNILSLLHTLIYSLIGQPITGADTNQWLCPLTCWLAISSLRSDSKFRAAVDYTPVLAHWQYHIRNTHLHQAQIFIDNYEDGLIGYVSTFYLYFHLSHVLFFRAVKFQCATYLNEELVSPWNTVRWHQHYASNIVYSEAAPPCITWSPDMSKVDCQGHTLEIAHLHLGLQKLLQSVEQCMDALCGSIEELDTPSDLTEDFTNDRMSWSWLDAFGQAREVQAPGVFYS